MKKKRASNRLDVTKAFPNRVEKRLEGVSDMHRRMQLKVLSGNGNARACIKAMCLQCMGYERKHVEHCLSVCCPLWNLRPFKSTLAETVKFHEKAHVELDDEWKSAAKYHQIGVLSGAGSTIEGRDGL